MNQRPALDERLRAHLADEAVPRAPDRVLEALVDSIRSTPQRRRTWLPWRYPNMPGPLKLAVATAVIVLAFAGGIVLRPLGSDSGGALAPTPSDSAGPSASPLPSPIDTSAWVPFTSARHGFSLRYPARWRARQATVPWDFNSPVDHDLPGDPAVDELFADDGVFWLASSPVTPAEASDDPGGTADTTCWPPIAEWPVIHLRDVDAHYHGGRACQFWETQIVVDGRLYALAASGYMPLDVYEAVMATVRLDPSAADDTPVATPTPRPAPSSASPAASPS
jgi:hypothetical protein